VRYWDTSAVLPLLLEQEATAAGEALLDDGSGTVAWWGTSVEVAAVAARLRREERLTLREEERVLEAAATLRAAWVEVLPSEEVRTRAKRLLRVHALKAADALQLAAALVWAGTPSGAELVTLDERLALAARLEGFRVLPGEFRPDGITAVAVGTVTGGAGFIGSHLADHLLERGFKHFAFCGWTQADDSTAFWEGARERRFRKVIKDAGFDVLNYDWPEKKADRIWAKEQKHLAAWIESLPKPIGLMAANDQRGRHVIEAARIAEVKVPDEVAVIGVDNDEVMCEMCTPSLSSVALNTRRIGYMAAELLRKLMDGAKVPSKPEKIEPLGVVARESTDTLALDDRQIADAVRFIRTNCHRPIQVSDVLEAVPVSRKTLEVRFQKALGRTPHAEIQRLRLDRVKQLLVQTDWPLKRVANSSGFTYAEHMHAVFRNHMDMTPNEYRAMHSGG